MEKKKVILDVDTGTDDAIAIMTAVMSENLEVLGVCAVNGTAASTSPPRTPCGWSNTWERIFRSSADAPSPWW